MPIADKEGVPFFSPFTGSEATRNPAQPGVFNIRASYKDEAYKIVQHLATVGIKSKNSADGEARRRAVKKVNEWQRLEVVSKDGVVKSYLNGTLISTATLWGAPSASLTKSILRL